jgi:hypothetical protein
MSDEQKRLALVKLLEPYLDDQNCYRPTPLVPLELFFDGNDDNGSIGGNLPKHPSIEAFRRTLSELRDGPSVSGVWVIAKQHDWKPSWPHSDEVLIRSKLDPDEIADRASHLGPDTVDKVLLPDIRNDVTGANARCASGEHHVVVWWD